MSDQESSHFNTIINAMPDIMALIDGAARIVSVNAAWGHFARENRADEDACRGKGLNYFTALQEIGLGDEGLADNVMPAFEELLSGSRESFELEYPCHTPSEQRWFQLRLSVVPGEKSRFALATHIDITRRKTAEMELARETRKLREESFTDPLTKLRNRRALEVIGQQYWRQAQRSGGAIAVCYFDLDDFKPINDHYGHQEGDKVLQFVAEYLLETFRKSDVVTRVGGDEFVVLAWLKNPDDVERIRNRVKTEHQRVGPDGRTYTVSMSLGIAVHDPESEGDLLSLIERADTHMYKDKKSRKIERRE